MQERTALAEDNALPVKVLMQTSKTYIDIAERITDEKLVLSDNPKAEIIDILREDYGLIDWAEISRPTKHEYFSVKP